MGLLTGGNDGLVGIGSKESLDAPLDIAVVWWTLDDLYRRSNTNGVESAMEVGVASSNAPLWREVLSSRVVAQDWAPLVCAEPFVLWRCDWALRTIDCESKGDPWVVGSGWYQGQFWYYLGLFQIAVLQIEGNEWLFDPYLNTLEAHIKYASWKSGQVPNPWLVCGAEG